MKKYILYATLATIPLLYSCSFLRENIRIAPPAIDPTLLESSELEQITYKEDTLKTKSYSLE